MITVTRKFDFCYGHSLPLHKGKCCNQHGHNAVLEVTLKGGVDERSGMVLDFGDLKKAVEDQVIDPLDHQYLNEFIENPTAENILMWIHSKLVPIFGLQLYKLRLYETPNCYAEWR